MLRSYLPAIVFVLLGAGVGGAFAVLDEAEKRQLADIFGIHRYAPTR